MQQHIIIKIYHQRSNTYSMINWNAALSSVQIVNGYNISINSGMLRSVVCDYTELLVELPA